MIHICICTFPVKRIMNPVLVPIWTCIKVDVLLGSACSRLVLLGCCKKAGWMFFLLNFKHVQLRHTPILERWSKFDQQIWGWSWNYHWISFPMPVWWNHGTNKQQATRVWTHDNNNRIQCGDPCFIQVCSEGHSMLDAVGSGCNQTTWQVEMGSTGWMVANLNTELTWYMIFSHIFIYIYVRIFHSDIYIYVYI